MPGHKTHDTIGVISVVPVAITAFYLQRNVQEIVVLATGIIAATYFLSPDLDLNSRIYRRWGLLRWIWFPYQKLIPHRSWLSHSGPISATLRLAYLYLFLLPFHIPLHPLLLIVWISAMIADTIHVLADMMWKD